LARLSAFPLLKTLQKKRLCGNKLLICLVIWHQTAFLVTLEVWDASLDWQSAYFPAGNNNRISKWKI
jgi:hypothetical protein